MAEMLRQAELPDRLGILAELTRRGPEAYQGLLAFAERELTSKRSDAWPLLLDYFQGTLDRRADLVVLRVLDLEIPDQTKVDALIVLKDHTSGEWWVLPTRIRGKETDYVMAYGGWRAASGPIVLKGQWLTMDDVDRISRRAAELMEDDGQSERVRQHAAELVAWIEYKDATTWGRRQRLEMLQGRVPCDLPSIMARHERAMKEVEPVVEARRRKWEEERAKTEALEKELARAAAAGATEGQRPAAVSPGADDAYWYWLFAIAGAAVLAAVLHTFLRWCYPRRAKNGN